MGGPLFFCSRSSHRLETFGISHRAAFLKAMRAADSFHRNIRFDMPAKIIDYHVTIGSGAIPVPTLKN
jgi:hypothetical protein